MIAGLIGKKIGMTQIFSEGGIIQPVTVIEVGPCTVTQIKTEAKEGYNSIQLGFGEAKRLNSPQKGHLGSRGQLKHLREFKVADTSDVELGNKLDVSMFQAGELVDITGLSKGKGFAGVVKRHNFSGGPKTHGQSDRHRAPGAIGAGTDPGRVFKGTKMAGHMGNHRTTVKNLTVVKSDPDRNLLLIKGAIPGAKNGLLEIKKSRGKGRNSN